MDTNWDAVKAAYVTTQMSLAEVAKKFGLKLHTVGEQSRKNGWVAARMAFRAQAAARAVDAAGDAEVDRLGKIISAANSMAAVIEGAFADPDQFHRHIVLDMDTMVEKQFDKLASKAIKDFTGALKDMTLVLRTLHNLPTQAEAEAQRIAAERLKLEQRKVDAAEKAGEVDKSIVVKFEGDMEAFSK